MARDKRARLASERLEPRHTLDAVWEGDFNSNYGDNTNWNPGGVPVNTATILFNAVSHVIVDVNRTVASAKIFDIVDFDLNDTQFEATTSVLSVNVQGTTIYNAGPFGAATFKSPVLELQGSQIYFDGDGIFAEIANVEINSSTLGVLGGTQATFDSIVVEPAGNGPGSTLSFSGNNTNLEAWTITIKDNSSASFGESTHSLVQSTLRVDGTDAVVDIAGQMAIKTKPNVNQEGRNRPSALLLAA